MLRKGFTLVEMLVVVAVLVTLMTIMFRLGAIGNDAKRHNATVSRIQRVENALSGYYAAFGSYPPVKLHGSRNPFTKVDSYGTQSDTDEEDKNIWGWTKIGEQAEQNAWAQVKSACDAQPVDCRYPFPRRLKEYVDAESEEMKAWAQESDIMSEENRRKFAMGFDDGVTDNIGRHGKNKDKTDWEECKLFKFGLLSYLLPRYLIMMNGDASFFTQYAQWKGNNDLPCDPLTGRLFVDWSSVREKAQSTSGADLAHVANIASQVACARWMANFEGTLCCNFATSIFGVNVQGNGLGQEGGCFTPSETGDGIEVYSPNGYGAAPSSDQYVLDGIMLKDGWGNMFYYYSPAPYQSYAFWSGGANGRTFPPWIARKDLDSNANRCIALWIADDITNLSH